VARQSSAKASTPVRIWSGPQLKLKAGLTLAFFIIIMPRLLHWAGLIACVVLIAACFMPWTFHADVQKNFTGFFSAENKYGRPGKYIIILTVIILAFMLLPKIWAKRTNLFLAAILVSYAVKSYILYTSCYMAYCPEKKAGVFLMLSSSLLVFVACIFPNMKLKKQDIPS
jgi:hypothetical protein